MAANHRPSPSRSNLAEISSRFSTVMQNNKSLLLRCELYGMAALSMVDMVTDILMTYRFHETGRQTFALACAACIILNLLLQALGCLMFYWNEPWHKQLKEQFITWSCIKPGVDAYRVATNQYDKHIAMDHRSQMTGNRCVEMVTEGIPGTVIQLSAFVTDTGHSDLSTTAMVSLTTSIATSACISAHLSWHWDLSEEEREKQPQFYGYFPQTLLGQVIVFTQLLLMSLFTLAIRSLSVVLFSLRGGFQLVGAVLGGELCLYLIIKLLRKDFLYWVPIKGWPGIILAFVGRIVIKIAQDWTCVCQFRHPNEVGGYYFVVSMAATILMGIASILLYETDAYIIYVVVGCCIGLVLSFVLLLFSIERNYVRTFFDTRTCSEFVQDCFHLADEDLQKFNVFHFNENKWRSDIGEEVKAWVNESILRWLDEAEEEEGFLDDFAKSIIPDWIVEDPSILNEIRNSQVQELMSDRWKMTSVRLHNNSARWSGSNRSSGNRRNKIKAIA
ncbi:hypothetical protein TL16_g10562 [Triparma laevis f. inornata]|uniref:Uncharacterized protein n=2 Tax=Triparma laevis TaxID=1534972 RepID=A0A9W7E1D0_9STRA|nr:hypothetical protein TrLO_g6386 [Triparma laevis f. longispina]GMH86492.1 hypothetical protein TL16_g10562 [Triparma laevis f. inornata]